MSRPTARSALSSLWEMQLVNWPFLWAQLSGARLCNGDTPRSKHKGCLSLTEDPLLVCFSLKCYQF